jgi:hypothetical protein
MAMKKSKTLTFKILLMIFKVKHKILNFKRYLSMKLLTSLPLLSTFFLSTVLADAPKLENWSANAAHVTNASCRSEIPNLQEMSEYNEKIFKYKYLTSKKVSGVSIEDEDIDKIQLLEELTIQKAVFSSDKDIVIDLKSKFKIPEKCHKVDCVLEAVFGEDDAIKMVYLKTKYGFNVSSLAFENSSNMNQVELDSVIKAIQSFPSGLFPMLENKQLTKFLRGYTLTIYDTDNSRVFANSSITFFDHWSDIPESEMKEYVTTHELAHYIADQLSLNQEKAWHKLSGWSVIKGRMQEEEEKKWQFSKTDVFISNYAQTNPAEDFAETVSAYRYNPELLRGVSPDKYQFMKEVVFSGIEYTGPESCQEKNSFNYQVQKKVNKTLKSFKVSDFLKNNEKVDQIIESCRVDVSQFIFDHNPQTISHLNSCLEKSLISLLKNKALRSHLATSVRNIDLALRRFEKFPRETKLPNLERKEHLLFSARAKIKESLVYSIYKFDKSRSFYYGSTGTSRNHSIKKHCQEWSASSYLFLNKNTYLEKQKGNQLELYRLGDLLDSSMNEVCLNAQRGNDKVTSLTKKVLRKSLQINILNQEQVNQRKRALITLKLNLDDLKKIQSEENFMSRLFSSVDPLSIIDRLQEQIEYFKYEIELFEKVYNK